MKLNDIAVMQELRMAYTNANRVLSNLKSNNVRLQLFTDNGIDLVRSSGQDAILVRQIAIQVWEKYIEELKAKLMLLGVTDFD